MNDLVDTDCKLIIESDKIKNFELGINYEEIKNDKSLSIIDIIDVSEKKTRVIATYNNQKSQYIFNFEDKKLVKYTFKFSIKSTKEFKEIVIKIREKENPATKFIWENKELLFSYKENNNSCHKFLKIKYSGSNKFVFGGLGYVN